MESKNKPQVRGIITLVVILAFSMTTLVACTVNYKFNGASIDYTQTKTIQIGAFPIRSTYVWAPMQSIFQNKLTDIFASQTRLRQVKRNGDLILEGEIVGFDQFNKGVSNSGYSNQVQLKMTVNVRFTTYDATQQLVTVQEELVTEMCKDLTEQIFNATVANW